MKEGIEKQKMNPEYAILTLFLVGILLLALSLYSNLSFLCQLSLAYLGFFVIGMGGMFHIIRFSLFMEKFKW